MPAINVDPMRPAAWAPDFPFSGGMNPPCEIACGDFAAQRRRPRAAGPEV